MSKGKTRILCFRKRLLIHIPVFHSAQVSLFVMSLGEYHADINRFKLALRDFLIQLKEFSGDNTELFLEEKEAEQQMKAQTRSHLRKQSR